MHLSNWCPSVDTPKDQPLLPILHAMTILAQIVAIPAKILFFVSIPTRILFFVAIPTQMLFLRALIARKKLVAVSREILFLPRLVAIPGVWTEDSNCRS